MAIPKKNNDITSLAEKVMYYNNLLINHKWLSAEEGNRNMEKHILKIEKKKKKGLLKWLKIQLGFIIGIVK
jgi:hypothetical protein